MGSFAQATLANGWGKSDSESVGSISDRSPPILIDLGVCFIPNATQVRVQIAELLAFHSKTSV